MDENDASHSFAVQMARLRGDLPNRSPDSSVDDPVNATANTPRTAPFQFAANVHTFSPASDTSSSTQSLYTAQSTSSVSSPKLTSIKENGALAASPQAHVKSVECAQLNNANDSMADAVATSAAANQGPVLHGDPAKLADAMSLFSSMSKATAPRTRSAHAPRAAASFHFQGPAPVKPGNAFKSFQSTVTSSSSTRSPLLRQPPPGHLWSAYDPHKDLPAATIVVKSDPPAAAAPGLTTATKKSEGHGPMGGASSMKGDAQSKGAFPADFVPPHLRTGEKDQNMAAAPKASTPVVGRGLAASKFATQTFPPRQASTEVTSRDNKATIKTEGPAPKTDAPIVAKEAVKIDEKPTGLAIDAGIKTKTEDDFSFARVKKHEPAMTTTTPVANHTSASFPSVKQPEPAGAKSTPALARTPTTEEQKLRKRIEKLECVSDQLLKTIIALQEESERRNFLGTAEAKRPYLIIIKLYGQEFQLQVCKQLTVGDVIRRVLVKAEINARSVKNPRITFEGVTVGHMMTLGELGILEDSVAEITYEDSAA